ncbi:hypothetical protein LPJ81_001345 [Coemansia sp. IMI 209127]|nr:hypothetical protein LPJ81_001345 [Coemansia sp. IMI 209127]
MIKEYTLMRNPDAAFALFDDVCKVGFAPTYTMLCALGTSAALYKDASKSSECLQKVITCLNNWSFTVECRFFASVLTGYDQSQQYTLFDALAGKLLDRFQYSNEYLNQVIMANAAKRGDDELMCKLAPMELQNIRKYPRFEKFAQHLWQSKELQSVLDISRFPENNLTANMKLSQDIDNVEMSLAPETLVCRTLDMIEKGYTPSFRLFARLIRRLSVCGSNDLAIETFEKLSAAGVPSSIELLLLLHTLYLHSSDGERAIAIFEAIRARLTPSDFGDITLHAPTMRKYVLFLLDRGEVSAAYDVVAFLHTLPCDHKELPYSTLIEYCISHRMLENSYDMIAHVVQHDISIEPRVINLCFHLLEKNESATDYANFLRYVSRIDMMDFVPDSAFETFFLRSMQGRKISDIEWAVDVLANAPYEVIGIWRVILKRLSKSTDDRTVIAIVRMAIDFATNKERTGMDLLAAAAGMSETLVVVADSVLVARHIHDAAKIGIDGSLLSIALRAVASSSLLSIGSAEYIDILESVPDTELSVNPYEAVCAGLAQRGHIREVETVLDNMLMRGLALNANMLNIIMSCFIHAPPPPQSPKLVKDDYRSGHAEPKTAEGIETDTMDDGGYMHIDESDDLLLTVLDHEMNQTEIGDSSGRSEFYENALSKVVSFWKQFEFRGLSPDRSSYSVLLYAYIKAQKFTEAEIIINDIVEMGLEHNNYTATQWIVLRLKQDDVKGALSVLDAIGNKERCDELLQTDKRYIGLQHVQRNAFHFLPFVTHHLDNGKHAVAVEMLLAMHTLHLKATAKAYHDILVYLANEDSRQAFLDVVQQMVKFDILINSQIADVLRDYSAGKNTK